LPPRSLTESTEKIAICIKGKHRFGYGND